MQITEMNTAHALVITLLSTAACALACAGGPSSPEGAQTTQNTQQHGGLQVSHRAVEIAQRHKLPPVPEGQPIGGPFEGPNNSIFYTNRQGRITFLLEDRRELFLSSISQQGQITHHYAFNPEKMYRITPQNTFDEISYIDSTIASEIAPWPMIEPTLQVVVTWKQEYAQQLQNHANTQPQQHDARYYERMAAISRMGHETNMNILRNIGSSSCTAYYDGATYVGCW